MSSSNIYPLDRDREVLSEVVLDDDRTIKKRLLLHAPDGDQLEIEIERRLPWFISRPVPQQTNRKVIAEEADAEGNIHKVILCEENGQLKEYFIKERLPPSQEPKLSKEEEKAPKRAKYDNGESLEQASDKNIRDMLISYKNTSHKWKNPSDSLLLLLAKTPALSVGSKKIVSVHRNDSLWSAWKKMHDHSILSVPVLKQDDCYYGFLDRVDIVSWVVNQVGEKHLDSKTDFSKLPIFHETKVRQLIAYPISKKNTYRPFPEDASLFSVMEELARGTHRVGIVNKNGELHAIVTQNDVLRFINQNLDTLGDQRKMKVEEMYLSSQYVMAVMQDEKAIDAFRLIKITKVGGVAVVDDQGQLLGNISAKDLTLPTDSSSSWFQSARKFVEGQKRICVNLKDDLEFVIHQLCENHIHRIYVVNESMEPIGLLSMGDVLAEIIRKPPVE